MFLTKHGDSEKEDAMNNRTEGRTEGSNKFCITFFFFSFFFISVLLNYIEIFQHVGACGIVIITRVGAKGRG